MEEVVVLIGFMGVGKTATGRALAGLLGWGFSDLDEEVERRAGKPVERIFAEDGEARFREWETEALVRALEQKRTVLATGGGVLLREENRKLMAGRWIFYLHASPEECFRRIRESRTRRPLLEVADPRQTVHRIYAERERLYESIGQRVDTEGRPPEIVAGEIAERLRARPGSKGA